MDSVELMYIFKAYPEIERAWKNTIKERDKYKARSDLFPKVVEALGELVKWQSALQMAGLHTDEKLQDWVMAYDDAMKVHSTAQSLLDGDTTPDEEDVGKCTDPFCGTCLEEQRDEADRLKGIGQEAIPDDTD